MATKEVLTLVERFTSWRGHARIPIPRAWTRSIVDESVDGVDPAAAHRRADVRVHAGATLKGITACTASWVGSAQKIGPRPRDHDGL